MPGNHSSDWPKLDAIVVPTARDPGRLTEAARLARILDCTLVTLHSGQFTSAAQAWQLLPEDLDLIAIDIAAPAHLRLPLWETSRLLSQTIFARRTDLSAKRNLGLMLSRMLGWSRILFLDDDITAPNPDELRKASGLLGRHHAVGLHIGGFPDHSVVCHAYKLVDEGQESFIGGGALAVETERCDSFFPDIYNDDWFFMLDPEGRLRPVTRDGEVRQEYFDPFRNVDRARAEEFGDVLAEGTYWLLDQGGSALEADHRHWAEFLVKRRRFIERILDMAWRHNLERSDRHHVIAALRGSLDRLACVTPELCERYLQAWAHDREMWLRHIAALPAGQAQQALGLLSVPGAPPLRSYLRGHKYLRLDPAV
jgi:glycosyltransferase involved in cell wall biosynthesis